jgi:DNA-binding transcriptional LysR family regulator
MKDFPNINFNIYTSTQNHLLTLLSEGHLDLGCFFYIPDLPNDLEIVHKQKLPFRLVIKKGLEKNKEVIQSFIGSREIDDTSTHSFPTVEYMRKKYPKTRIIFSSNSITLHKQLVVDGKGVSIMPEFMVKKEIKRGTLVDLFPRKKFSWDLFIVKRKSSHLSIPTRSFCERWHD